MQLSPTLHDAWASLLAYPDENGTQFATRALHVLEADSIEGSQDLAPMREFFAAGEISDREELFTKTFDGSDDRALEVGWHVHGENYARGALMVRLRKLMGELELFEISELPDHIGVVLGLVGRLDRERADALARGVLLPALVKMLEGFGETSNPYRSVFVGMQRFLSEFHSGPTEQIDAEVTERSKSE